MIRPPPRSTLFPYTPLFRSVDLVEAALLLVRVLPPPAALAFVLPRKDRTRARLATDADEAALMQRVERHVVRAQIVPDLGARVPGERVELDQARALAAFEAVVELDDGQVAARPRILIAALPRDPCTQRLEVAPQRGHLPHAAAFTVTVLIEGEHALAPDERLELLAFRKQRLDAHPVALLDFAEQTIRLRVQPTGVEREHAEGAPEL